MTKLEELNIIIKESTERKVQNFNNDTIHYSGYNSGSDTLCGRVGYTYGQTSLAMRNPVNCKSCLKAMAGLLKQKSKLMQSVVESRVPETCQIVKTIKTSDGKIFGMDRIEDAIKHEALFLQTLHAEKCAKEFANSIDYIIRDIEIDYINRDIEVETSRPRQQLMNLYALTKQHHTSRTSDSRKAMLQALYYFLIENDKVVEKIARRYKRISKKE